MIFAFAHRNLANAASLLWHAYKSLPAPSKEVNWAGMYTLVAFPFHTIIVPNCPLLGTQFSRYDLVLFPYQSFRSLILTFPASPGPFLPPGFYVLDPSSAPSHPSLILGPFQGKVACQTIVFGRGVCGTAAQTQQTQLVPDVDQFPGHIACDGDSKSEIVVPITVEVLHDGRVDKKVVAIIDVDCAVADGFDELDRRWLEDLAGVLGRGCDW